MKTSAEARRLAPLLACLAMVAPFSIDTLFPAFHAVEHEFAVSPVAMQQTLSIYLGAFAAMSLFHGALSDAFGRRPVLLVNLSIYLVASVGCALAPNLPVLLAFRALQGLSAGAGSVIGRAIIRDRFEGPDATRLMSQVTLIFTLAPALAPIVGGWVLSFAGWRMIFWALTLLGAGMLVLSLLRLPETHPPARRIAFSVRSMTRAYIDVFADRRCVLLAGIGAVNVAAFFMFISSAPVIVLDWLKLSEREFAWLFLPTIGGMMVGAWVSGRLAGVRSYVTVLRISFVIILLGNLIGMGFTRQWAPSIPWVLIQPCLLATGAALSGPTLMLMMLDRFPAARGTVASMQAALTLATNAFISGVISPWAASHPFVLSMTAALFSLGGGVMWVIYHHFPGQDPQAVAAIP